MSALFKPVIWLMDQLKFPAKFTLIITITAVPILVFGTILLSKISEDLKFLYTEQQGLSYLIKIRTLTQPLQVHRGLNTTYASGQTALLAKMDTAAREVDSALKALQLLDEQSDDRFKSQALLSQFESAWLKIKINSAQFTTEQAFAGHTQAVQILSGLAKQVADQSGITLDPVIESYYLGDALVNTLPGQIEGMGQARAIGSAVSSTGQLSSQRFVSLSILYNSIKALKTANSSGLETALSNNQSLRDLGSSLSTQEKATQTFSELINTQLLQTDTISISSQQIFDDATRAINESYALYDAIAPALATLFADRINNLINIRLLYLCLMFFSLILALYMMSGLYLSLRGAVNNLTNLTEKVAGGDLTSRLHVKSKDEIAVIIQQLNRVIDHFAAMVGKLNDTAIQLAASSEQFTRTSRATAESMQAQNQQTESEASAINQMQASAGEVNLNITHVGEATSLAESESVHGVEIFKKT